MKKFLLTLSAIMIFTKAYQQNTVSKAQSIMILEISGMVEWPQKEAGGAFVIGILGESDVYRGLSELCADRTIGGKNIEVVRFDNPGKISSCNVLFIPFSSTRMIYDARKNPGILNTLIITERSGALKAGAAVNFVLSGGKLGYEVSEENAALYGLKIAAENDAIVAGK
jgi:hypothetical protein